MLLIEKIFRKLCIKTKKIYYRLFYKNFIFGKNLNFRRNFNVNLSKEASVVIGKNVFFNNECSINGHKYIKIGSNCIFGEGVKVYDHNHRFRDYNSPIYTQGYKCENVKIGDNCWIGSYVVILPGTEIGNNVIIGAGCVVSGKIDDGLIVTSNRDLNFRYRIGEDYE